MSQHRIGHQKWGKCKKKVNKERKGNELILFSIFEFFQSSLHSSFARHLTSFDILKKKNEEKSRIEKEKRQGQKKKFRQEASKKVEF